jgi:hypothetical protein
MGPKSRVGPSSLLYGFKLKFEFRGFYPKTRIFFEFRSFSPGRIALDSLDLLCLSVCLSVSTSPPTWETGVEVLAHFSKVMRGCTVLLEVNASFLVIFVQLWNEELPEHVQIHDTFHARGTVVPNTATARAPAF